MSEPFFFVHDAAVSSYALKFLLVEFPKPASHDSDWAGGPVTKTIGWVGENTNKQRK